MNKVDTEIVEKQNHVRIYGFSQQSFEPTFRQTIARICAALGIKIMPEGVVLEFIEYALKHKFSALTFQEIELAFVLNSSGEWEKIEHFQQFNIEFVGPVLNQYLKRKLQTMNNISGKLALPEKQAPSTEEKRILDKKLLQAICDGFDQFKANPSTTFLLSFLWLEELTDRGLISKDYKEDWSFMERAEKIHKQRVENGGKILGDYKTHFSGEKEIAKKNKAEIKSIARELVLKDNFAEWQRTGFDLRAKLLPILK